MVNLLNWDSIAPRLAALAAEPVSDRDHGLSASLLRALAHDPPPPFAVRRFHDLPVLSETAAERGFGPHVDQTNHSVVVDERMVVKWLAPPVPLPHPTPEIFAHLVEVGFTGTAPPYLALTRASDAGEELLALVTGYLPEARDGWEWCVDEAESGGTRFAGELGRLAADLHVALSTLPGGSSARQADPAARAADALAEALALTGGADGAWLATRAGALAGELEPLRAGFAGPVIRIHGDLHVGQILRWRDGYAVIDFDGNPTVADTGVRQPAARDVAQLTTSLEHVAQVAVKRRGTPPAHAAAWAARARAGLLDAYRDRLSGLGRSDLLDETLIRPFEVEQECRELIYAARHLPRWRYAPMGVLRTWYPEENLP
ncbi:hypothetical protein ACIBQ6_43035 [Nonomuraea sp. NPDC049655]|uniref:hypothetical protein n=1 Tax=Nonomuraea sp. NPDC049655 TaxID=3364355 RepID=UPI00378E4202